MQPGPRGTRAFSGGWALGPRSGIVECGQAGSRMGSLVGAHSPWALLTSPEGQAAGAGLQRPRRQVAWGLALDFKAAVAPVGSLGVARDEVGSTGLAWLPSDLVPTPQPVLGCQPGVIWSGAGHLLAVWLCQAWRCPGVAHTPACSERLAAADRNPPGPCHQGALD